MKAIEVQDGTTRSIAIEEPQRITCNECGVSGFFKDSDLQTHKQIYHKGHQHQFTVPVETVSTAVANKYPSMVYRVTRLRCTSCTEERTR